MIASDYRYMRIVLFFDLPTLETADLRNYTRFRKYLLQNGYVMMQFSVYCKIFPNRELVKWHLQDLKKNLPPDGSVMCLQVTEKQYKSMLSLVGSKKALDEKITSEKLLIF